MSQVLGGYRLAKPEGYVMMCYDIIHSSYILVENDI
jgi:hypothetical protein